LFENLFRNAVNHGGGEVTVTVAEIADGFYVADDGAGIPDEERDDIFEAGYSTADDGTGFGLAIVKEIVEAHSWEIRVTDSETGGTRFEIINNETAH
jgi:signal transduction histidine kinase